MKTTILPLLTVSAALAITGCTTLHDKGPYAPQNSPAPALENTERVVLFDPGVQYSLNCTGLQEGGGRQPVV